MSGRTPGILQNPSHHQQEDQSGQASRMLSRALCWLGRSYQMGSCKLLLGPVRSTPLPYRDGVGSASVCASMCATRKEWIACEKSLGLWMVTDKACKSCVLTD